MEKSAKRRRRGTALEETILDAAWAVLSESGYLSLTFEGVARRVGTSRPVLNRRWPTRASLASAAIARHVRLNPMVVPDLGNVRDELKLLLRTFSDSAPPRLVRLIYEMSEDLENANTDFVALKPHIGQFSPIREILGRAADRGEIDLRHVTPRVETLATNLARHEIMMTLKPLSDEAITEIIDQIFLPLINAGVARTSATSPLSIVTSPPQ